MAAEPSPRSPRHQWVHSRWWRVVSWILCTLALIMLTIAWWIRYQFGPVGIEAIVTNIPVGGRTVGNVDLAVEAPLVCVGGPVLVMTGVALLVRRWRRRAAARATTRPRPRPRLRFAVPIGAFAVSMIVLLTATGVPQHAVAVWSGHSFARYYVQPRVTAVPSKPLNLITIYLESMENGFGDEEVFGKNLLAPLDEATADWHRFDGLHQYPGGGWTMAGLVSTQCGIPLKSAMLMPGSHANIWGEDVSHYLPGATCLGDILETHGYTSAWMGGADTKFAGKKTFLTDHGYSQIQGRTQWEAAGEKPTGMSAWGLSDHRLFAQARTTVDRLRDAGTPFHLTILTLDTHEPAGIFPSCTTDDPVHMATAIQCSMRAVAGFLSYLESSGALDDTVVVVMGDHLKGTSGASDFKTEMAELTDRTIVLRIWSPDPVRFNREEADQLSMLPTTLELLHFRVPDGRAGLGVSLIGHHDLAGSIQGLTEKRYQQVVRYPSVDLYQDLWASKRR